MSRSNRDRQRQWQARQRTFGRRRFTVMLTEESCNILKRERIRTGSTLTELFNQAIQGLAAKVSDNNNSTLPEIVGDKVSANQKAIAELREQIVNLIGVVGLSSAQVAERFNAAGIEPTPAGASVWRSDLVEQLYRDAIGVHADRC